MIQKDWSTTISKHFFYTKELLLGVKIWPKTKLKPGRVAKLGSKPKSKFKPRSRFQYFVWLITFFLLLVIFGVFTLPNLYYQVFPADTIKLEPEFIGSPLGGSFATNLPAENAANDQPAQDPSLPLGDWLIISQIGVKTEFKATKTPDEALKTGAWLEPNYGKPGDTGLPIIIAAHRFGWNWWWQSDYGRLHSFYLLPETKPGDLVQIISDQRQWTYEIFAAEEGEDITNYDADLILYTCKHLSSPVRHIRYARLI